MIIREAIESDAPQLARVGVDTWRSTYRGIMADEFLDNVSYDKSRDGWVKRLKDIEAGEFTYVAEDSTGEIVGYAYAGPERDRDPNYPGEIYALYVYQSTQKRGVGRLLMQAVSHRFMSIGIKSMRIWVLSQNPSRGFYERMGGRYLEAKVINIGGKDLEESAYVWDDINSL